MKAWGHRMKRHSPCSSVTEAVGEEKVAWERPTADLKALKDSARFRDEGK